MRFHICSLSTADPPPWVSQETPISRICELCRPDTHALTCLCLVSVNCVGLTPMSSKGLFSIFPCIAIPRMVENFCAL